MSHVREWGVSVDYTIATRSSVIAFGSRFADTGDRQPVLLKVIRAEGDEWRSGEILQSFDGNGVARVYEYAPGAVLLERIAPGSALAEMSLSGRDAEATKILANVIEQMSMAAPVASVATVEDWGCSFDRYLLTAKGARPPIPTAVAEQIPDRLVELAHQIYSDLCASQRETRLLHGDLQHYNVLKDSGRGWLAIDPKGVVGEVEYEIGAILRNPIEKPELFTSAATIERRIKQFVDRLGVDYERVLAWGFAQAVLSAIWDIEDGIPVEPLNPALRLARVIEPMLSQ
jgi:streptomycin 6-kinase